MRRFGLWAGAALIVTASSGAAQAQTLGATFSLVHQAYANARSVQMGDVQALELRDVDYAGLHWKVVDFVFNKAGRLEHLTMSSDVASYDDVLHIAATRMQEPPSVSAAAAPGGRDLQIRVCEQRGGGVTVTYEPASTLS